MEEEVFMGNGSLSKVKEIGMVIIKTTNGLTRVLTSVRHVPSLKRNMIFLGILNTKGCLFVAHHGFLNVKR